jgi:hypothetical protein
MKSIAAATLALTCLTASTALAQAAKPPTTAPTPRSGPEAQLIEGYFNTLKSGYPADATAKLFIQTPLMQKNPAATDKLTNSAATYINFYGPITHWSFANEKVFAPGVKRQTWVLYTIGAPIFFTFDLYVSATGVGVLNVNINDKYESAF